MKINRTVTIKLSREELVEIIKDHLSKEGFTIDDTKHIDFDVKSITHGYGTGEYQTTEFTGCTVICNMNTERKDK